MIVKIAQKFGVAVATSAVVVGTLAPIVSADTTLRVSGNGAGSSNVVDVAKTSNTTVVQTNDADIDNDVDVDANTGGNSASYNTGGDVRLRTGDADVDVTIKNMANSNMAVVKNCDCDQDAEITIQGNGAYSDNTALLTTSNNTQLFQTNDAKIDNDVDVDADTGWNDADKNTGGDVTLITGDASVDVDLHTAVNSNVAKVGDKRGDGGNDLKATISGNGAFSSNVVDLAMYNNVLVSQDNYADVDNDVDIDADTGWNSASKNTGGDTNLWTGDASVNAAIHNFANFNAAWVDCGCIVDLKAKIDGNGAYSWNDIITTLVDYKDVFQTNDAYLDNDAKRIDADTGWNDVDYNTGTPEGGDPFLLTGDADADVLIHNKTNVNTYGKGAHWGFPHDLSLSFTFDLGDLMEMLDLG